MANPSGKIRTEFDYRAQDLNKMQANKGFRDSLPFVLASTTLKSIAESVKTARASLTSIAKQAQKTVSKARAVLYKQIGGQYGVAVYEENHNSANEARIREANSNSNKVRPEVRPNKTSNAGSRTNHANTPVNKAFSDIVMINPPPTTQESPRARESVQVWIAAAAASAIDTTDNLVRKTGNLATRAGKELGEIGSKVASGSGEVVTKPKNIGYIR
jgi:hypothetical protein